MPEPFDFDALARKANESNGAMADLDRLFGAAFSLEQWHFIPRGQLPDINPYIAANSAYADGKQMIRAFTDTERLQRFATENSLTEADGSALILSIPTAAIIDYLEQLILHGVHGLWFNSDTGSDGFFIPLQQLRPIKAHLENLRLQPLEPKATAIVTIKDGLMLPSGFVAEATYFCDCFCRIPQSWVEGKEVKQEAVELVYDQLYGKNWQAGNSDGSRYVVRALNSRILSPDEAKAFPWDATIDNKDSHFFFFIASENGELKKASRDEFQVDIQADKSPPQNIAPASNPVSYLNWFRQGRVKSDTSLTPFFRAISPLLEDYAGAGEFTESFSPGTDATDMGDVFEDIGSNAHGPILRYRSYLYRRSATEPLLEVKAIGSNLLTHTQTGEKLTVHFTIHNKTDVTDTKLIVALLGSESEVESLSAAIEPALGACEFKVLLQTKRAAAPESFA